jgi:hypothetical protein
MTKITGVVMAFSILCSAMVQAATKYAFVGPKQPGKLTTPATGRVNIGEFINLNSPEEWGQVIFNIASKYPDAKAWVTWGIGPYPELKTPLTDDQHEAAFTYLDGLPVSVFLETRPGGGANMVNLIDTYFKKFGKHKCLRGFGIDLEFYKAVSDADAKAMDEKLKSFNPEYRLFFKHWETGYMPKTYRGKGDLIFMSTSSEETPTSLIKQHADFCNSFSNSACGAQIGYPADEPSGPNHSHPTSGASYDGWDKFKDPIKDWGDLFLKAVTSNTMEMVFTWVTVKSERFAWDLTKGATIPSSVAPELPSRGRFLRAERTGSGLTLKLADGLSQISVPAAADIMGRKVVAAQGAGFASGRYFLRVEGTALSASIAK